MQKTSGRSEIRVHDVSGDAVDMAPGNWTFVHWLQPLTALSVVRKVGVSAQTCAEAAALRLSATASRKAASVNFGVSFIL